MALTNSLRARQAFLSAVNNLLELHVCALQDLPKECTLTSEHAGVGLRELFPYLHLYELHIYLSIESTFFHLLNLKYSKVLRRKFIRLNLVGTVTVPVFEITGLLTKSISDCCDIIVAHLSIIPNTANFWNDRMK